MGAILLKDICIGSSQKDVLIGHGRILRIAPVGDSFGWEIAGDLEVMNCRGKVAVPGFVNMHTHAAMSLLRGVGEDMVFQDWLSLIWKLEEKADGEFVRIGTRLACLEMIRTGTTTFNDQYWHWEQAHGAASGLGIRHALGFDIIDRGDPREAPRIKDECEKFLDKVRGDSDPLFIPELAFHAIYSVSEPMMLYAAEVSRRHGLNLHIHLSETRREVENCKAAHGGLTPVEYLADLGVLSPRLTAAHTLWLTGHDIELLAEHGVHCVHNVNSNTKLSSGYRFLYNELRDAGVNVCIGTDGCASSNNLDMLEAMKTSAIFQKAWREDPAAMPLDELLRCATENGAKALRFEGGVIREGAVADISIVDTDNSFFLSSAPFLANLVYSAHSECIDSVICNGEFLMRGREVRGEREILDEARELIDTYKL